jgi:hypothetical protein
VASDAVDVFTFLAKGSSSWVVCLESLEDVSTGLSGALFASGALCASSRSLRIAMLEPAKPPGLWGRELDVRPRVLVGVDTAAFWLA